MKNKIRPISHGIFEIPKKGQTVFNKVIEPQKRFFSIGWEPKITFDELVEDMCKNEL